MSSTLKSERVQRVLERMRSEARTRDPSAKARVAAVEAEQGHPLSGAERADLYRDAHLSVSREAGELLYILARSRRAEVIVEFGASLGFATLHLAAALRDSDGQRGLLISSELHPDKADEARKNLREAGLDDLVDLRMGDARDTLAALQAPVDLLLLDGWNDLYLEILELVRSRLAPSALVVADMSFGDLDHERYRRYVHAPTSGFASIELPLGAGMLLSVRTPAL